ncbi:hypothetical protein KFK09_014267 [Dendrobium nobile]|uniref:Cell wall hydroxyproline-rich glycoprotein n=1 Tax=Dendrobium nobile TaxID=94219 RepID=A0A8T3B9E7_DENNO|nr:hypothetical protein KFK09_014267 [Dendrobium nobile]
MKREAIDPSPIAFLLFILALIPIAGHALTDAEAGYIRHRQLLYYRDGFAEKVSIPPSFSFPNPRLRDAYIALQSWKLAIISDPKNKTGNWVGPDVCHYTGVFCAPLPSDPSLIVVASIDLNHGDIAGFLPEELGLLCDLAVFHINSNRFCGAIPNSFDSMHLLFELDVSNNRFAGKFPDVVLRLPSLHYFDIRFNEFDGEVPDALFEKKLDAIFINNNRFFDEIPDTVGSSPVSVLVLANNRFHGCVPSSLGNMSDTLEEIIFLHNKLKTCLPKEIGLLKKVKVFDASFNSLVGELPEEIEGMVSLEELDVAHNYLTGEIPEGICELPRLKFYVFVQFFYW